MREDQERRFQALVQTQQEDRELFRSWMDREVRAGGVTSAPALPAHMPLNKMGPQDDPEAFIDLFERTAEACGWPQTNWPVRLIPLLSGEAQMAAQQLPVQNLLVYDDLKRAILQRVGLNPEQQRQRFRSLELGENGRPFVMAQQLRDACRRWLLAGGSDVDQIIDRVVLEQFIARLPKKTAQWVQCHRPTSLDLAIQLAEDQIVACHGVGETLPSVSLSLLPSSTSKPVPFPRSRVNLPPRPQPRWRGGPAPESAGLRPLSRGTGPTSSSAAPVPVPVPPLSPRQSLDLLPTTRAAGKSGPACWRCGDPGHFIDRCPVMEVGTLVRVPDAPQAAPDQAGLYQIPVSIKGGTYWALVDSGCNQTSIHQSLIQPEALDKSRVVQVRCVHGDVVGYPRLMDRILRPHAAYAAAYLDDIIIYSQDWQRHMVHLRAVLRALRGAGLTANPKKCAIGRVEVRYLGFHLGHGQVRPQISKTAAVATCPRPKTKKEVRQFLGLAGYYRRFVPNYSDLTSPLTDLTKKEAPDRVRSGRPHPPLLSPGTGIHSLFGPRAPAVAPPYERYQCADHPLKWKGGALQSGRIPGLSQAVGVCGSGGVVLRNRQLERRLGDEREELEEAQRDCLVILELWIGGTRNHDDISDKTPINLESFLMLMTQQTVKVQLQEQHQVLHTQTALKQQQLTTAIPWRSDRRKAPNPICIKPGQRNGGSDFHSTHHHLPGGLQVIRGQKDSHTYDPLHAIVSLDQSKL
ncbi:Transposon Tf2-9 polyprotein [Labeo rohita]|uniref:ribonuclease H n=1 Tax=Labeo rohita TaxID=84645 RepID=A0ABQ8M3W3_LABRO|nr:Transposon Tf2-9 polyprotein [Labeo rohita]